MAPPDEGANLTGEGIGGTIGIGSGDNIAQGVGEGGPTPAEIGVGIGAGVTTGIVDKHRYWKWGKWV